MENVRKLIRWKSSDPTSLLEQTMARAKEAAAEGKAYGVVLCFIWEADDSEGNHYDCAFSALPAEVILMASEKLRKKALD